MKLHAASSGLLLGGHLCALFDVAEKSLTKGIRGSCAVMKGRASGQSTMTLGTVWMRRWAHHSHYLGSSSEEFNCPFDCQQNSTLCKCTIRRTSSEPRVVRGPVDHDYHLSASLHLIYVCVHAAYKRPLAVTILWVRRLPSTSTSLKL